MEEREAINNRTGRERRLFCVEAMLRRGEVGGFCLYCRPHKNSRSQAARALAIWCNPRMPTVAQEDFRIPGGRGVADLVKPENAQGRTRVFRYRSSKTKWEIPCPRRSCGLI